ncbi:DUF4386 domain-containing protein [Protaetiibacter larvae]|uniref:DUF4386 domain-containing protein n=1 Tax=Protaetiibacter larvae TaxID=2592654 RepID=A0A5C1Y5T9_9MICO|nr:DUF4386 domain-containing protein [Protaetiibacter larvae]QEO08768.1 DUF4386 domain-containing protein [Protaetiibacter larvae]
MTATRRTAALVGALFLVTHVTSVGARILYTPVVTDPTRLGDDTPLLVGALLEVVLAVAVAATAFVVHPAVTRHNPGAALGYVALRTLEASVILAGVVAILTLASIRTALAADGVDHTGLETLAGVVTSFQDWTFVIGPGLVCGVNTVLLAWIMFRSGLVPRFIGMLGIVGGPVVFLVNALKVLDLDEPLMPWLGLGAVPVFAWEILLALYLLFRGFRPTAPDAPLRG